jgi:predicted patatin/cPLA2 family phospholipase
MLYWIGEIEKIVNDMEENHINYKFKHIFFSNIREDVAFYNKLKKILADNIKTLEKSLVEIKAMYDAGFMESLDVDRLQLSYDNLNIQLENIDGLIDLSKNLLKFV